MFRRFLGIKGENGFGVNKSSTFKKIKEHRAGSRQAGLHEQKWRTLGGGNIKTAVRLPPGEDLNEWLASNTVDFYNEVSIIWGIIFDEGLPTDLGQGQGFPPGVEYHWADGVKIKVPIRCSSTEYISYVMDWIEEQMNNEMLFPSSTDIPFPKNFIPSLKQIYNRLFRIFAIIYSQYYNRLDNLGASAHVNTSFKHFMFFVWEFDLVEAREFEPIRSVVEEVRAKYNMPEFSSLK